MMCVYLYSKKSKLMMITLRIEYVVGSCTLDGGLVPTENLTSFCFCLRKTQTNVIPSDFLKLVHLFLLWHLLAAADQADQEDESNEADHESDNLQQREIVEEQVGGDEIVLESQLRAVMAGGVDEAQVLEAADDVDASASVLARRRLAFVDVDGTSVASESTALADGSRATFFADAAIFARIGIAVAAVFAAFAAQPGRALATVVVVEVVAAAVEETRRRGAWIAVDLAA